MSAILWQETEREGRLLNMLEQSESIAAGITCNGRGSAWRFCNEIMTVGSTKMVVWEVQIVHEWIFCVQK